MKVKPNYSKAKVIDLKAKGDVNSPVTTTYLSKEEINRLYPKTPSPIPPYGGGAA